MSKITISLLRAKYQVIKQYEKKIDNTYCWVFEVVSEKKITDKMLLDLKQTIPNLIDISKDGQDAPKKVKTSFTKKPKPITPELKPKRTYRGHMVNENENEIQNKKSKRTYRGHTVNETESKTKHKKLTRTYRGHIIKDD